MVEQIDFYIPKNVSTRFEIIKGVGIRELIYTGIAIIIGIVIGMILNKMNANFLISMSCVAVLGGGTFVLNMKDNNNQSVISMIRAIVRFYSIQKFYKYERKEDIEFNKLFSNDNFAKK
ncbi:MAG: PrgI family protein [Clostridia bacterium]|nr:PrgI family protein [Clostridia bacterium]